MGDKIVIHEKPTEEIRELAALFSLGALTQHEARSFEAHILEGCRVCKKEYNKFKHITAEIGFTANETAAPDYIREMILALIEPTAPEEVSVQIPESEPEKQEAAAKTLPSPAPRPVLTQLSSKRLTIFPWILVVILAVAATLIFYAYHTEQAANNRLESDLDTIRSEKQNLELSLESQRSWEGDLQQIVSTVSKPETRILHLAGYDKIPTASGAILWDVQENKCLIFGYMPPIPSGKAYQLWYLTTREQIPSGMFRPDPDGRIYRWFPIPESITSMTMFITLEPEGGSKRPTSPYYAIARKD
jgi:cell division protein FtsL